MSDEWVDRSDEMNFRAATAGPLPYGYRTNVPKYYWQEPRRIARYYHAIRALPPGAQVPSWVDREGIDVAYNYMSKRNGGQPWYNWQQLRDDDPANDLLKQIGMPPPDAMPSPEREKYYNPAWTPTVSNQAGYYPVAKTEAQRFLDPATMAAFPDHGDQVLIPTTFVDGFGRIKDLEPLEQGLPQYGGMTKTQYDALEPWQKAVVSASPWMNTAVGAAGGALTGGLIGGIPGALIGGIGGGLLARSAEQGFDPETGKPLSGAEGDLARITMALGEPAMKLQQGIGTLGQIAASISDPDRYGTVQEVLSNLGAAFEAGRIAYPAAFSDITGTSVTPMSMIGTPAGETWKVDEGAFASSLALTEARRRIAAGTERPEDVLNEIRERFGISGTARDMIMQMFLDPLNMIGDVANAAGYGAARMVGNKPLAESFQMRSQLATLPENFRRGLAGEKLLDAGNMFSNDVIDSIRIYGSKIRQMPVDEAVQFGAVSRWIAGMDKAGNIKKLDANGKVGLIDHLRGLTPKARAHEVLAHGVDGIQALLVSEADEPMLYAHLQQIAGTRPAAAVEALENNPLPRWFSSAEAQGMTNALKDTMPKVTELHDRWVTTRDQAALLTRVADMMGVDVYKLMGDLRKATPEEANTTFRSFIQSIEEKAKGGDKGAARLLDTIRKDQTLTRLDGKKLKDFTELFSGKDPAPFSLDIYKGQLFHLLTDNLEGWAVRNFKVKPANWAYRTADLVKRAQGKVLLGLNPTFLLNNALNNLVTLGWDGLLEWAPASARLKFIRQLGFTPSRLRAGATAAEVGDDVLSGLGEQIRRAGRAGDIITSMDDFIRKADKFPDFATLSQKFERWSSEVAQVVAMRRYWDQIWTEGRAITSLPDDLAAALEAFSPGMSKRVKKLIERGKSRAEIEKAIFKDTGAPSIHDVMTQQEKDLFAHLPGFIDELDQNLQGKTSEAEFRSVFADAIAKGQQRVQDQVARNMQRMTVEAAEKVKIEGGQGLLDLFDHQMQNRHDFWLYHLSEMDSVAEDAAAHSGQTRKAIWQQGLDRADRNWNTLENIEGSKWLGAVEALAGDKASPEYVESLNNLSDQHANWQNFYQSRRALMDAFYTQAEGMDDAGRSQLWHETNVKLNQEYVNALLIEDEMQARLDQIFIDLYARQFPDKPDAIGEATRWRGSIQQVRQRMAATMVLLRTGGQVPPELEAWLRMVDMDVQNRVMNLTKGIPPYAMSKKVRQETMQEFMHGIYAPYIREMLEASNGNAPGRPVAPQPNPPAAPPQAPMGEPTAAPSDTPSVTARPADVDRLAPPEEAAPGVAEPPPPLEAAPEQIADLDRLTREVVELARAEETEVFRIASEYGIGSTTRGDRKHILNVIKQYYRVDDFSQVTPDMAAEAFSRRQLWKGAIDRAAQDKLNQRIKDYRADMISRNQRLLAAPKDFTRDALFREAEEIVGSDQAAIFMELEDQKARYWAEENNSTVEEYYRSQQWEHGGIESGAGPAPAAAFRDEFLNAGQGMGMSVEQAQVLLDRAQQARRNGRYPGVLGIEYSTRELDATQRLVEAKFAQYLEDHTDEAIAAYWQLKDAQPNILNTDTARELSEDYRRDRTRFAPAVHEPSSALIKRLFNDKLENPDPERMQTVYFLAGGAGSGKSSIDKFPSVKRAQSESQFVYDGTLANYRGSKKKIDQVLSTGNKVILNFVYRDVADATANGVIPRAINQAAKEAGGGRIVTIEDILETHMDAIDSFLDLHKAYQDNPNVEFIIVDNSRGRGNAEIGTIEFLEQKRYNDDEEVIRRVWKAINEREEPTPDDILRGISGGRPAEEATNSFLSQRRAKKGAVQGFDAQGTSRAVGAGDGQRSQRERAPGQADELEPPLRQLNKGITRWMENNQALVHLYESADISTFVEESTHVWLPMMGDRDVRIVEGWMRAEYGIELPAGWQKGSRQHAYVEVNGRSLGEKEIFRAAFMRYLIENQAPVPTMRRVFENMKRWLLKIYGAITGGELDIKMNDEIVDLFDRWMGKKAEPPTAAAPEPVVEPSSPYRVMVNLVGEDGLTAAERAARAASTEAPMTPAAVTPETPVSSIEPQPAPARVMNVDIRRNTERGGIEVKFDQKPSEQTIFSLKKQGYRWSSRQKVWYKRERPGDWDKLGWLRTAPEEARTVATPDIDRFPTWEEWQATHPTAKRGNYELMVEGSVIESEIGFDEAAQLIGEDAAHLAMVRRFEKHGAEYTQQQFIDALYPEHTSQDPAELKDTHYGLVFDAVERGENVPDEILKDYPDLYVSKETPEPPPANVYDGIEPKLFNAPEGQGSLFGEETAGFGLIAQKAPNETFNPPTSRQPSMFGLGEFTEAPKKPAVPEKAGAGPLFEQPSPASPEVTVPARVTPQAQDLFGIGDIVRYKGKEYEINYMTGGQLRLNDPTTHQRIPDRPTPSEVTLVRRATDPSGMKRVDLVEGDETLGYRVGRVNWKTGMVNMTDIKTGKTAPLPIDTLETSAHIKFKRPTIGEIDTMAGEVEAARPAVKNFLENLATEYENRYPTKPEINPDDLRAAVRQAIIDRAVDYPETTNAAKLYNIAPIPGFENVTLEQAADILGGVDEMKKLIHDARNLVDKPQPPVDVPITIQPTGIENAISQLTDIFTTRDADPFTGPRAFEEWMQQVLGKDMNDETNLNLAYDALEGAFNQVARTIRADLDARNAPLVDRLKAMAELESRLLRARRTISKMKLQQFSTPLSISEAAGYAADVRAGDVLMEPTAGTANLVDKFSGRPDIVVQVNEIDGGRQQVLSAIGYKPTGDNVLGGEWVLGPKGKLPPNSNVVICNPPWGAYSTGKYGRAVNVPVFLNDWSQRFTYLIMQRLGQGGRFVGVMPQNWLYTVDRKTRALTVRRSAFLRWLETNYHLRAVIESPPDAYKQRGTDVGSLLVVIDKEPRPADALPAIEAWGDNAPKSWDEYAAHVQKLGKGETHGRTAQSVRASQSTVGAIPDELSDARRPASGPDATGLVDPNARTGEPAADPASIGRVRPARATPQRQPDLFAGEQPAAAGRVDDAGGIEPGGARPVLEEPAQMGGEPGGLGPVTEPGRGDGGPAEPGAAGYAGADLGAAGDTNPPLVERQPGGISPAAERPVPRQPVMGAERKQAFTPEQQKTLDNGVFIDYVARSPVGGYNHHASAIVETKALSGIPYPDLEAEYQPSPSVMRAYQSGALSVEGQLDPIWAAVQQNDKYHSGLLVADDVGTGKARTAAGFALDRVEKGRKRILVITKGNDNVTNLMKKQFPSIYSGEFDEKGNIITVGKDFPARMIEMNGENMPGQYEHPSKRNFQYQPAIDYGDEPAVYFVASHNLSAFRQFIAETPFDSIIVDEAHEFKNIDTKRGGLWYDLHKAAIQRNADFMYLSATPAVDIAELQYLYGLKIWTVDGFKDWIGVITGKLSPDQVKRKGEFEVKLREWENNIRAKANADLGPAVNIESGGKNYQGYEIGNGLVVYEWGKNVVISTARKVEDGLWMAYKREILRGGTMDEAIMIAREMQGAGYEDFTRTGDWAVDRAFADAERKVFADKPRMGEDIRNAVETGYDDDPDIEQDKKNKRKKRGSTAFSSTLPPEHTEQIMRELKVGGYYMSRDILRTGVELNLVEYKPPAEAVQRHNKRIDLYRRLINAAYKFGRMNKRDQITSPLGAIQADAKRALFDIRIRGAIDEAKKALENGEQVVISLVSVNEANTERGNLFSAINAINTQQIDNLGEGQFSDPVKIPEGMIEQQEMLDILRELGGMKSPVEILREAFGSNVGFLTGAESTAQRIETKRRFQTNQLPVIVISDAGKTGISLHDITGTKRRHLIEADYNWSATVFKQELGRVDRTGQKSSPKVTVMHMGDPGEVKFLATITNRMKGLGATAKGGADSTGTGAMEQFEMGSQTDRAALQETWRNLSPADKDLFLDRYFRDIPKGKAGDDISTWTAKDLIPGDAEMVRKWTMALQSMRIEDANRIMKMYVEMRDAFSGQSLAEKQYKAERSNGEILRKTQLGDNLILWEVRSQAGHKFGVVSGVLTPHMQKLGNVLKGEPLTYEQILAGETEKSWRSWINFGDDASGERISGLEVRPSYVQKIAKDFGQQIAMNRTPESALIDLRAGDKIPVRGKEGAEWELYIGKGGQKADKIIVDKAKMAQRDALLTNGATYDARGSFFYVPEDNLQAFLKRFPIDNDRPLAQQMPPGETYAFGPSGERYNFRYRIVSLDELVQSHLDTFDPNPRYPRELQPRARDRAAYREQVAQIARDLDERILTETHQVDTGTPIIGNDLVVENGNGRVMALRRARMDYPERWQQYQQMLREKLPDYDMSADELANIKDPVLVRERTSDVDRVKFAGEAQASQSMTLTVDEMAGSDSKYVDDAALANLVIGEEQTVEGALRSPANRDLVNAFLNKLPAGEKSAFLAPDGSLSLDGLTRLRNAIFVHVYPGDSGRRLAEAFLVSQSEAISNIRAAIFDTLGAMSQAEALIRQGRRDADLTITDDLARAVDQYARLKQRGESISDYVNQLGLVEKETDAFQDAVIRYLDENARSRKRLRALLALYADNIINTQQDPAQDALFGGVRSSKGEILDAAAEQATGKIAGFEEVAPAVTPEETAPEGLATPIDGDPASTEPQVVPAAASPLGTAEQYHEPPVDEAAYEGWMKEVEPALRRMQDAMLDPANRRTAMMDLDRDLDPATKKALRKYLGQVGADLTDAKLATIRYGEMKRDSALLNYTARTGMDNMLGAVMPYEFWMTRSMMNWAIRAMGRPSILANWARLRNLQEKYMEGEDSIPTRLKKKVKIPTPFLPDWMGDSIYIDPLKQLFPFEQMARPWEQLATEKNMELRKAESALDQMVQDEQISQSEAAKAKASRSGPVWQRAVAQARQDMDSQMENPLDFAFAMSSPSLPLSIAYNIATGNKDRIGQLPISRLIQANTAALGIGGARGVNVEYYPRKAAGLPEVDRFEDYRVDRMLANLTAEGLIAPDDAERAMIDREGEAYTLAQQRVSQMGIAQYWGAPLGLDMFPEGERETRGLRDEYDKARVEWSSGRDRAALQDFYDKYPEYETRAASFREPTERLRRYLISEVWDKYMDMPDLYKRQAREQLGPTFQDAFLDKETRSYDSINTTTLATWAQQMGANNPKKAPEVPQVALDLAPESTAKAVQAYYDQADEKFPKNGMVMQAMYLLPEEQRAAFEAEYPQIQAYYRWKDQYLADHPDVIPWVTSESNELYGLPNDIQAYVYNYRARKEDMFPGIYEIQNGYYDQTSSKAKSRYMDAHPELAQYWSWRREVAAAYPQAAAYILSDTTMQKAILGDEYTSQAPQLSAQDLAMLSQSTQRALLASVYSGEELRASVWEELEEVWITMGKPYGTLENWYNKVVKPVVRGS